MTGRSKTFLLSKVTGILFFCFVTQAQEVEVGFRASNGITKAAIDIVIPVEKYFAGRVHGDLSFVRGGALGLSVLWDFVYKPLFYIDGREKINWYAGGGVFSILGNEFDFGATGELGLEYRFPLVPIAIGLDWRPQFKLTNNSDINFAVFGLNVRWIFRQKRNVQKEVLPTTDE